MNSKTLVVNGIIAALYVAITLVINPIAFSAIQFRIPEIFNHLIVFNKKYFFGIIAGVCISNLFSPMAAYDLIFGVGQSILALVVVIFASKYIKNIKKLMLLNILVFTFSMFLIAIELKLALDLPFWYSWLTTAVGEFMVMLIGAPIVYMMNKRIDFAKHI